MLKATTLLGQILDPAWSSHRWRSPPASPPTSPSSAPGSFSPKGSKAVPCNCQPSAFSLTSPLTNDSNDDCSDDGMWTEAAERNGRTSYHGPSPSISHLRLSCSSDNPIASIELRDPPSELSDADSAHHYVTQCPSDRQTSRTPLPLPMPSISNHCARYPSHLQGMCTRTTHSFN
jgi:hypothetical protein